jgi:hypothetical protein
MIRQFHKSEEVLPGERVLHRIAALTLGFGFASAAVAMVIHRQDWAKGLAGGAMLGWLNFRWLSRGIRAMVDTAMSQSQLRNQNQVQVSDPSNEAEVPASNAKSKVSVVVTSLVLLFRYALVAFGVYVIFVYLHVPLFSIGLGLCALVAAIMTASVWEVLKPES